MVSFEIRLHSELIAVADSKESKITKYSARSGLTLPQVITIRTWTSYLISANFSILMIPIA